VLGWTFPALGLLKLKPDHFVYPKFYTNTPNKMLNKERINQRKSDFKKGIDLEEGRKKREEITVSIRKKKKEEQVSKRRNIQLPMFAGVDPRPADPSALETVSKI
jgi:formylmethanofuran dehydrogenase subunit B